MYVPTPPPPGGLGTQATRLVLGAIGNLAKGALRNALIFAAWAAANGNCGRNKNRGQEWGDAWPHRNRHRTRTGADPNFN